MKEDIKMQSTWRYKVRERKLWTESHQENERKKREEKERKYRQTDERERQM